MKTKNVLLAAAMGLGLMACGDGEPTPDMNPTVSVSFNPVHTSSQLNARLSANSLSFSSGYITLREIRFEGESEVDSVEVDFNLEQEVVIDFATGTTTPDISALAFQPGTYEEIEIELELQDETDKPGVVINGTFTDGDGTGHPLRFEFNSGETFEIEQEGVISLEGTESVVAMVSFNPTVWFAGVSAEQLSAASKTDGVIVISESQNQNIFEIVADGLDLATEVEISVGQDSDEDDND